MQTAQSQQSIRRWLILFMLALFISGLTAIPVDAQLRVLLSHIENDTSLSSWLQKVLQAYNAMANDYPFLFYGYDWLAFAHFILAILFIGPYRDPVKNIWVIQFGLIACGLVLPFAFVAGYFRGIPLGWQLIDCSFGVIGFFLLSMVYKKVKWLAAQPANHTNPASPLQTTTT